MAEKRHGDHGSHREDATFGETTIGDTAESIARRHYEIAKAKPGAKELEHAAGAIAEANPELERMIAIGAPVVLPFLPDIAFRAPGAFTGFLFSVPPNPTMPDPPWWLDEAEQRVPGTEETAFDAQTSGAGTTAERRCTHRITKVYRYGAMQEQEELMDRQVFVRLAEIGSVGVTAFGFTLFDKPTAKYCVVMAQRYRVRRWRVRQMAWKHVVECSNPDFRSTRYADLGPPEWEELLPPLVIRQNEQEQRCFWEPITLSGGRAGQYRDSLLGPGVSRGENE